MRDEREAERSFFSFPIPQVPIATNSTITMSDDNKDDAKAEGESEQLTIRVKDQVRIHLVVFWCRHGAVPDVGCGSLLRGVDLVIELALWLFELFNRQARAK